MAVKMRWILYLVYDAHQDAHQELEEEGSTGLTDNEDSDDDDVAEG